MFGIEREKNFGTGKEEGAGDAWKVAPAYACSLPGVARPAVPAPALPPPPIDTGLVLPACSAPAPPLLFCGRVPLGPGLCLGMCSRITFAGVLVVVAMAPSETVPLLCTGGCSIGLRLRVLLRFGFLCEGNVSGAGPGESLTSSAMLDGSEVVCEAFKLDYPLGGVWRYMVADWAL